VAPAAPRRVLIVTETGDAWPSGRIRALGYRGRFAADGIDVTCAARSVPWLTRLIEQAPGVVHAGRPLGLVRALRALNRRLGVLRERRIVRLATRGFDAIYLQKVASAPLVRALRAVTSARLVYDLNDAVWLPSRREFADGRIADILTSVDAISCDGPEGLRFARTYCSSLYTVPDPCQVEAFDERRPARRRGTTAPVIGWIGGPATLFNLFVAWEALERVCSRHPNAEVRLVGVGHNRLALPPFEAVRPVFVPFYDQARMIDEVFRMDIGLFPMFDVEDSRIRGILKATVYMSGEACVLASAVGQVPDLIETGTNGLLARSPDEWTRGLSDLVENADDRQRLASAGLATVRRRFSLEHCYSTLIEALSGGGDARA